MVYVDLPILSSCPQSSPLERSIRKTTKNNNKKAPAPRGGPQICPSSVEFTSARDMNTEVKSRCE